jgi:hypothetical protein
MGVVGCTTLRLDDARSTNVRDRRVEKLDAAMTGHELGRCGGRYWIRTSDPADVNRVL